MRLRANRAAPSLPGFLAAVTILAPGHMGVPLAITKVRPRRKRGAKTRMIPYWLQPPATDISTGPCHRR